MATAPTFYFDKNGIKRTVRRTAEQVRADREATRARLVEFEQSCREAGEL